MGLGPDFRATEHHSTIEPTRHFHIFAYNVVTHVLTKAFAASQGVTFFLIYIYFDKKNDLKPRILHLGAFDMENLFEKHKVLKSGKLNCA